MMIGMMMIIMNPLITNKMPIYRAMAIQYVICSEILSVEMYKLKSYFTASAFSLYSWDFNITVFGILSVLFTKNIYIPTMLK